MDPRYEDFLRINKATWSKHTYYRYYLELRALPLPEEISKEFMISRLETLKPSSQITVMGRFLKLGKYLKMDLIRDIPWPKIPRYTTPVKRSDLIDNRRFMILAGHAHHPQELTFLELALESGARRGELAGINCEDLVFEKKGLIFLTVSGKTGTREIPLYESAPRVKWYLETIPSGRPFLRSRKSPTQPINYQTPYRIMDRLYNRSREPKPPGIVHITRHSRATELATILTEYEMRLFFGWSERSEMPNVYIHLANADLVSSFKRKVIGIEDTDPYRIFKSKRCEECGFPNVSNAKICAECLTPLDREFMKPQKVKRVDKDEFQEMKRELAEIKALLAKKEL